MASALPALNEVEDDYELCSIALSDDTADDLVGPGRILGNVYSHFGRKVERVLGNVAEKMAYGPRATAKRLKLYYQTGFKSSRARHKIIERDCNRMGRYVR